MRQRTNLGKTRPCAARGKTAIVSRIAALGERGLLGLGGLWGNCDSARAHAKRAQTPTHPMCRQNVLAAAQAVPNQACANTQRRLGGAVLAWACCNNPPTFSEKDGARFHDKIKGSPLDACFLSNLSPPLEIAGSNRLPKHLSTSLSTVCVDAMQGMHFGARWILFNGYACLWAYQQA